jgi:hypothetical protein
LTYSLAMFILGTLAFIIIAMGVLIYFSTRRRPLKPDQLLPGLKNQMGGEMRSVDGTDELELKVQSGPLTIRYSTPSRENASQSYEFYLRWVPNLPTAVPDFIMQKKREVEGVDEINGFARVWGYEERFENAYILFMRPALPDQQANEMGSRLEMLFLILAERKRMAELSHLDGVFTVRYEMDVEFLDIAQAVIENSITYFKRLAAWEMA